ncbi:four helix bundle protein [Candidatus Kuenenbacteria bacterium]|nr:four helix bundle protein [Candidatus Kuenenbacteria bacterium]
MSNKIPNPKNEKYDLLERTAVFSESIIKFVRTIKRDEISRPLINQLVRSSTSIGANYCEADAGESKKDFKHKLSICRKEAKETMYWLRIIANIEINKKQDCREL